MNRLFENEDEDPFPNKPEDTIMSIDVFRGPGDEYKVNLSEIISFLEKEAVKKEGAVRIYLLFLIKRFKKDVKRLNKENETNKRKVK